VAAALKEYGQDVPEEEVVAMIAAVDADGGGDVDFGEFLQMMKNAAAAGGKAAGGVRRRGQHRHAGQGLQGPGRRGAADGPGGGFPALA
jgi:hypothetical protein